MESAYSQKLQKARQFQKNVDPHSPCGSLYNYYWIIASISQLQYGCGPNIYQMCKYFGTISSTVENIEVLWSAGALQKQTPCTVVWSQYVSRTVQDSDEDEDEEDH